MGVAKIGRGLAVMLAVIACVAALGGCDENARRVAAGEEEATTQRRMPKPPEYAEAARAYNRTVDYLDRIKARANILLTYFDEDGNEKHEDPEGTLQIVRPNKLALSLGKAGQILFWFGCDPEQYWWIDLSDRSKRIAAIGRHEKFDDTTAQRIGIPIKPLDLIRVLGVTKMDVSAKGATQWSNDGELLGITSPIGDRGFQRTWVDPKTYRPVTVEIFAKNRDLILVAEHTGEEPVEMTRSIPGALQAHPSVSSRVEILHVETQTRVRLTLTGVKDGPITDKAFDLAVLLDKYPVDRVIDLDKRK